jgi:hypothetical protein
MSKHLSKIASAAKLMRNFAAGEAHQLSSKSGKSIKEQLQAYKNKKFNKKAIEKAETDVIYRKDSKSNLRQ